MPPPSTTTDLCWKSAGELAGLVRSRRICSRDLLEHFLSRAEKLNPAINAIVVWRLEAARKAADVADGMVASGAPLGALHGVPITVKESYDVAGTPSTFGNPDFAGNIASSDSAVVEKLSAAGAIVYGKTNVPYALGDFQTYNSIYGTTRNPWDASRTPGGSSGGSAAALAAGLTPLEMGSDIGGSLRNPAHFCGVYAHKPTHGIVNSRGHAPRGIVSPADIAVCGPLARTAEDLALAMSLVAGPREFQAPGWTLSLPQAPGKRLADFRVALWLDEAASPVDACVADRLEQVGRTLSKLGVRVSDKARPDLDARAQHDIYMQLLRAVTTAGRPDSEFEEAKELVPRLDPEDRSHRAYYLRGMIQSHRSWMRANEARNQLRLRWRRFFDGFDVLLCPVSPVAAFPIDESVDKADRRLVVNGIAQPYMYSQLFWAGLTGACYLPCTVAPIGPTPSGLPVGMQIVGAEYADNTCIEFARLLAAETKGFVAPPMYA